MNKTIYCRFLMTMGQSSSTMPLNFDFKTGFTWMKKYEGEREQEGKGHNIVYGA